MSSTGIDPLAVVYASTTVADAQIVKDMLLSNGIHATVAESEGPFVGSVVAPSEVLVWKKDVGRAQALIESSGHRIK